MRQWPVPVQIAEPERIIGGIMTFKQLAYVVAGASLGGTAGAVAFFMPVALRLALFGLGGAAGMALSFVKVYDTPLDIFIWRWFRWRWGHRAVYLKGDE